MAAPPEKLCAHNGRSEAAGQHQKLEQTFGKFLGRDMVGVGTKRGVTPAKVRRIRIGASPATESRNPSICDAVRLEIMRESFAAELRQAS